MPLASYSIGKRADGCIRCGRPFADAETIHSRLVLLDNVYRREDFCGACRAADAPEAVGFWKTVFHLPPPPAEEPIKKENAESLLRRLLAREDESDADVIFILAVMLERKKILRERDVRTDPGQRKLRIYEQRKTHETFAILDPELCLDELDAVRERVIALLGTRPRPPIPDEEQKRNEPSGT